MAGALGSLRVALLAINLGKSDGTVVAGVRPQLLNMQVLIIVSMSKKRRIIYLSSPCPTKSLASTIA
jgi:hypothetical protein